MITDAELHKSMCTQYVQKNDRLFYLKGTRIGRKTVSVVREQYLRTDICCHSPLCKRCDHSFSNNFLSKDAIQYIIPTADLLDKYFEVFNQPGIEGIIVLQTVAAAVKTKSGYKAHNKLKDLLKDDRRGSVYFSNELYRETFVDRNTAKSKDTWIKRLILTAYKWFQEHLESFKLILLIDDHDSVEEWQCTCKEIFYTRSLNVMHFHEYLTCFHSSLIPHYDSLKSSLEKEQSGGEALYSIHLSEDDIKLGINQGIYVSGILNVNKRRAADTAFIKLHQNQGSVLPPDSKILIKGAINRNRAIHGDTVAVRLFSQSEWEQKRDNEGLVPTGEVVGVVDRPSREYVAVFPEFGGGANTNRAEKVLVVPFDIRIPKIRISTHLADELRNHRILVSVDQWDKESQYPSGHFISTLGPIGHIETETKTILLGYALLSLPFSKAQLAELPNQDWQVCPEEVSKRRDLRQSHLIYSVDPVGCEDIDDALSIRKKKNGNFELGIHIADVSYFVKPGSLVDKEALSRATTVYLADRRYDMLPSVLSSNVCSLWSEVDRYAVSVLCELDQDCNLLKVWYGRTVIRSAYKLTYEVAQAIADGCNTDTITNEIKELQNVDHVKVKERLVELRESVCHLMHVARKLHKKRQLAGALELEGTEVKIMIRNTGEDVTVEEILPKQPLEIHETIAECMIYANYLVAKKIYEVFPSCSLLRCHPLPTSDRFEQLLSCASAKGLRIDTSSNKTLSQSLENYEKDCRDTDLLKVLRRLSVYAMKNALYFSTGSLSTEQEFYHYGLALDFYTHFTSPIRRYADLMVHRMLLSAVGDTYESFTFGPDTVEQACRHINEKNLASKFAQTDSSELFQAMYFMNLEHEMKTTMDVLVTEIRDNGLTVFTPKYGLQGMLYLRDKDGKVAQPQPGQQDVSIAFGEGDLECHKDHVIVTYKGGRYQIYLLDHLLVKVDVDMPRAHKPSFVFSLLKCSPLKLYEVLQLKESQVDRKDPPVDTENSMQLVLGGYQQSAAEVEYSQSPVQNSLYWLVTKLRAMSLKPSPR